MSSEPLKIALINNEAFSFYHFRRALVEHLKQMGHDVTVLVPYDAHYTPLIEKLGVTVVDVPIKRFNSPLSDMKLFWFLLKHFKANHYDAVHTMTIKPNIYGTLAAKLSGIKHRFALVSGAGYAFSESLSPPQKAIKWLILKLYRFALRQSTRVWFQNPDDADEFVTRGMLSPDQAVVILSSGVDTNFFSAEQVDQTKVAKLKANYNIGEDDHVVLLVAARRINSKGIPELIKACHNLSPRHPHWKFVIVAPEDAGSYDAVPETFLREHKHPNLIMVDEFQREVEYFYAMADIMTLPSYYREGVPRSLIEAMSFSKPVVTTDSVGCRETVDDGKNGFCIPIKDSDALTEALDKLMNDDALRAAFGNHSRKRAETIFSNDVVCKKITSELYRLETIAS